MAIDLNMLWRVGSGLLGLGNIASQSQAQRQYEREVQNQLANATDIASQIGPETLNAYDASAQQQLGILGQLYGDAQQGTQDLYRSTAQSRGGFLRDLDTRALDLLGGYQNRYDTAARDIEGYGRQMAADIDTQAERERAEFALNPLSRGSTIGSSVNANITERRNAEQRRLGEDLVRQRVGLLSGLSGDQLAAQGGLDAARAAFDSALRGQLLDTQRYGFETGQNALGNIGNFYGSNAANRSGLINQGMNNFLSVLTGINNIPPQPNPYLAQLGAGTIQPVQPQGSAGGALLGGMAPALGAAGGGALAGLLGGAGGAGAGAMGAAAASIIVMICIDGESVLESPDGPVKLADARVGMEILNANGEWRTIIAKHYGHYAKQGDDYVSMSIGDRSPIVISMDHVIEGKKASEWLDDPDVVYEKTIPHSAGDVLLEDGSNYVANGYEITSLINRACIPALNILEPENQLVSV